MSKTEYEWVKELWPVFFPKIEIHLAEKLLNVIELFYNFFLSPQGRTLISTYGLPQNDFVYIDIPSLHRGLSLPDFMETSLSKPKDVVGCLSIAVSIINHYVRLHVLDTSSKPPDNRASQLPSSSSANQSANRSSGLQRGDASSSSSSSSGAVVAEAHTTQNNLFAVTTSTSRTENSQIHIITTSNHNTNANATEATVFSLYSRSNAAVRSTVLRPVWVQLQNLHPTSTFSDLKSGSLGRLVSIVGYVIRVSHSHHMVTGATYVCGKCEANFMHYYEDGVMVPPTVCPVPKCFGRSLEMLRHKVTATNIQRVKLQELSSSVPTDSHKDAHHNNNNNNCQEESRRTNIGARTQSVAATTVGTDQFDDENDSDFNFFDESTNTTNPDSRSQSRHSANKSGVGGGENDPNKTHKGPRSFECEVRGAMVNRSCVPGDIVNIVGIVKTISQENQRAGAGKEVGIHDLYIDVNSITPCTASGQILTHSKTATASEVGTTGVSSEAPPSIANPTTTSERNKNATTNEAILLNSSQGSIHAADAASSSTTYTNYTDLELQQIRKVALSENCFALLVASLCPDIFGHEIVKAGLLLGLLGGTPNPPSETSIPVRSDIHVLVVGDPGMGKSQLLRAAAKLSSRSVLVTAHSMSVAGLTAAVGRESKANGGDMVIEAGALVLADRGVCCIDELDKIDCDFHALLEAMEQQSISIAKSGVVTTLKSRASVLAAANPVNGHYNKTKTIQENLKMPSALLSRFDLVYILIDKPEEGTDKLMTEHIMRNHLTAEAANYQIFAQQQQQAMKKSRLGYSDSTSSTSNSHYGAIGGELGIASERTDADAARTLAQQLRRDVLAITSGSQVHHMPPRGGTQGIGQSQQNSWNNTQSLSHTGSGSGNCSDNIQQTGLIPADLFRKYIEYAKLYVNPHLTRPAAKVLQKQYMTMRAESALGNTIPVTTRHLECLIRLSQARAKAELREQVTEQDAREVVMLLQESLLSAFTTELGELNTGGRKGGPQGLAKQVKALVATMQREAHSKGSDLFTKAEIATLCLRLKVTRDTESMIEVLRTECYLLLKGSQLYKLQTV